MLISTLNFGVRVICRMYFSYKIDGRINYDFEEFMDSCMAIISYL